jgi:hypothetical protein
LKIPLIPPFSKGEVKSPAALGGSQIVGAFEALTQ